MRLLHELSKKFSVSAIVSALMLVWVVPGQAQTMDQIVAGAKKEGEVRVAITVREKEGNIVAAPRLIEAFEKKIPS